MGERAREETAVETRICAGGRRVSPGEPPYWEIGWLDPQGAGTASDALRVGEPKRLDRFVTRLLAPNPGPLTGPGTNTYLVGGQELAVIDPGPADEAHRAAILAAAAGRIRLILCTHTHADHGSGAAALARATGAPIWGRAASPGGNDVPVAFDRILEDGERLSLDGLQLAVIRTPGHASNHLCFLVQETGMLFCGDHIVQGSTVVIPPPDGNMRAYIESLHKVAESGCRILAPGHGYLLGEPRAQAERLVRHRLAREDKARQALRAAAGGASLTTLLPVVYGDVPAFLHPLAAHSLQAHLDKLLEDREITLSGDVYRMAAQPAPAASGL
jgi:glyoxylase-like metal-dependent hydrolase (beta-lactamase superfamily II)